MYLWLLLLCVYTLISDVKYSIVPQDPTVAASLLNNCIDAQTASDKDMKHLFNLSVPVITAGQVQNINQNQISPERYQQQVRLQYSIASQKACCFRAVAVMRSMAKLPPLLRDHKGRAVTSLPIFLNLSFVDIIRISKLHYRIIYRTIQQSGGSVGDIND